MTVNKGKIRPLTPKQRAIFDYVSKYTKKHNYSPSLEEIAKEFDSAISTIHQHIELIRKKGYLKKDGFQPRSISLLERSENASEVPLLGDISAGNPIEPFEEPEPVYFPANMIKTNTSNYYALKVKGDSMIDDDVWDGDIILIKHQRTADLNDMIVAITSGEVTLKRFGGIKNGMVKLIPRNPNLEPFEVKADSFEIRGKFAGLIRKEERN